MNLQRLVAMTFKKKDLSKRRFRNITMIFQNKDDFSLMLFSLMNF